MTTNTHSRYLIACLLLLGMVSCGGPRSSDSSYKSTQAEVDQARAAIDQTRTAYVAAWKAADANKIADLYAENALLLYPNQPAVTGRSAIRDYFKEFFAEFPQNEFELTSAEIEVAGSWAFDRGVVHWKGIPRGGGKPLEDSGKYLVVLQRQANGEWKVARDMDNSDLPATQSTRGTQ